MDESFDSVDNINQYVNPDKVKPAHHSERDKDRKFSRALEEKMEEDLEKKKKKKKRDTFIHREDPGDEDAPDDREEEERNDVQEPDSDATELNQEDKQNSGHVDLKA